MKNLLMFLFVIFIFIGCDSNITNPTISDKNTDAMVQENYGIVHIKTTLGTFDYTHVSNISYSSTTKSVVITIKSMEIIYDMKDISTVDIYSYNIPLYVYYRTINGFDHYHNGIGVSYDYEIAAWSFNVSPPHSVLLDDILLVNVSF